MDEIDLTDGNTKVRHAQPDGFVPSHLAAPMLRGRDNQRTQLEYAAVELGLLRAAADTIAAEGSGAGIADRAAAVTVSAGLLRVQRLLKALAAGALVALVAVGLSVGGARPAAAAEGPEPDPVATVRVVLDRAVVTVPLRVTVRTKYGRRYCASAWSAQGFLGRACSRRATLIVPAHVDAKALPLGLSQVAVTDDGDPLGTVPQTFTLDARRPSRFGVGTYTDLGSGDEFISASIGMYSPAAGRWLPQSQAPVYVQESTRRGWRTRVVLTSHQGVAAGVAHLGGGAHVLRLVRPEGATVTATTGTTRLVNVTTEPLDIV